MNTAIQKETPRYIVPSIDLDVMKAEFFDPNYIVPQTDDIYRVDAIAGGRFYASVQNGSVVFDPSVTTVIHRYHPMDIGLIKYIAECGGFEEYQRLMNKAAEYGTFLHILFADIILQKDINIGSNGLLIRILQYCEQKHIDYNSIPRDEWVDKAQHDILGFIQWIQDYKVEPIAVEIGLRSKMGYAGTVDLVCTGEWDKGTERSIMVVDFKSGRKNFYSDYAIQLEAYVRMWNENNPEHKVVRRANYGSKDYNLPIGKTVTPYRFKERTDDPDNYKWGIYLAQWKRDGAGKIGKDSVIGDGIVNASTNISDVIIERDPKAEITERLSPIKEMEVAS